MTARLAVFCSGEGTNLEAIFQAIETKQLTAEVALVVSDQPTAPALDRARRRQIEALVQPPREFPSQVAYDSALIAACEARDVDLVVLAGFMRILGPTFIRRFHHRVLNIHPALPPAFPGARAVRDALAAGVARTGVTVHVATEHVDAGPIILQEAVPIAPGETETALLARLHAVEHRLYPQAIQLWVDGKLRVEGDRVIITENTEQA